LVCTFQRHILPNGATSDQAVATIVSQSSSAYRPPRAMIGDDGMLYSLQAALYSRHIWAPCTQRQTELRENWEIYGPKRSSLFVLLI